MWFFKKTMNYNLSEMRKMYLGLSIKTELVVTSQNILRWSKKTIYNRWLKSQTKATEYNIGQNDMMIWKTSARMKQNKSKYTCRIVLPSLKLS